MRVEMNERHGSVAEDAVFSALIQWFLLLFALVLMAMLRRIAPLAPVEARATVSLGLLVFAAYVGGGIAQRSRLHLPRIVGYLIVGFVAGSGWLGLIRADEVQALSPIANGALALIALAAGCELDVRSLVLRGERRGAMLRMMTRGMAIPFALVTLVVLTVSPWFPITAHQPFRDCIALALVLGAMAAIVSPATTLALVTDIGAEGTLARTMVDLTSVQAVAGVLLLIVILAIVQPLATGGTVTPGIAIRGVLLLFGSIAAGAAVGLTAAQYLRVLRERYVEWVLLIVAFIVAQTVRLIQVDPVLVALAAGVTLRNVDSREGDRLRGELKRCAVPVYVVFFALAGSGLDLDALATMWPWALLLVGLRIHGLRWGARWAGGALAQYGWLALISQGGLAITLAALLRRAFPESNVSLEALLVAMIGMHQIAGPVCFQWALRRRGEVRERERNELDVPETALAASSGNSGM